MKESLKANPNVQEVRDSGVYLTYDFRVKLYNAWLDDPTPEAIRKKLIANGFDIGILGRNFANDICKNFRRKGKPSAGSGVASGRRNEISREEVERILLATGKFKRAKNGICFSEAFVEELRSAYPGKRLEEGIQEAGIDPEIVGYQRIYQLQRRLNGLHQSDHKTTRACVYSEEEIQKLLRHPYVNRISKKIVVFHTELYTEGQALLQNGWSIKNILKLYELPENVLRENSRSNITYRFRNANAAHCKKQQPLWERLSQEQKGQYNRIQRNRINALQDIAEQNFTKLREAFSQITHLKKKRVCEWIRDEVPKEKHGKNSLRGILKSIGISKSFYYNVLSDEAYEAKAQEREERKHADMLTVRQVAEYGGYPKGSRQIYMQMKTLTGRHMSRSKIMGLMREMGIKSQIRKANPARRGALKHLKKNVKPNLLKRTFRLHRPGEVFLTDVTYLKYGRNKLAYGSASIDSVTGRVYGFNVSECNNLEFVEETVRNLRYPEDVYEALQPMLHTDQGVLYLTDEFQELVAELGFVQSMSKRGNCWDNAPQESFFGHFKDECPYRQSQTLDELRNEIQRYCQYFNEVRGQWNRNKMTPIQFEKYLRAMSEDEFQEWKQQEEKRYDEMKRKAKESAIERARTLGV